VLRLLRDHAKDYSSKFRIESDLRVVGVIWERSQHIENDFSVLGVVSAYWAWSQGTGRGLRVLGVVSGY